nr:DUF368 domain-containing protein [uncultured Sellimonas sp.]
MALADSVPGVSGGTIAFLLGFYDKFIDSLDHIMGKDKQKKKEAILFLCKIAGGWIIGMGSSVLVLASLFEKHIYQISSLFLGLILFSIPLIISEEKKVLKGKYKNLIFLVFGLILVVAISCLNPVAGKGVSVDAASLNPGLIAYVFIAGMVAICAMVLPGISGSTLLLIFGLYIPIITSIKEVMHLHMNYLPVLIIFGLGVLTGIALVIKAIKTSLKKYRSQMIYLIIGMMLGSLYAIVVGPTTLEEPKAALSLPTFNILFFIIGAVLVLGMQKLKMTEEE